jgi:hypothetical protein
MFYGEMTGWDAIASSHSCYKILSSHYLELAAYRPGFEPDTSRTRFRRDSCADYRNNSKNLSLHASFHALVVADTFTLLYHLLLFPMRY